ncbi:MAG: hypothetical protein L0G99_10540, partial [Propionibacteriales bacterium]|nr:hypothetical protein [Propionibacteriales bacterium]
GCPFALSDGRPVVGDVAWSYTYTGGTTPTIVEMNSDGTFDGDFYSEIQASYQVRTSGQVVPADYSWDLSTKFSIDLLADKPTVTFTQ